MQPSTNSPSATLPARRVHRPGSAALPAALAVVAFVSLAICCLAAAFAFLSATFGERPRPVTPVSQPAPAPASISAQPAQRLETATLQNRIASVKSTLAALGITAEQMLARREMLDQRRKELLAVLEQSKAALAEAEETERRTIEKRQENAARREQLLREAAELNRRIAELEISIADAGHVIEVRQARANTGPQIVECVREGVVLQPQHVMVPSNSLGDGTLAVAVRRRGAYFVVRPDGFSSFVLARAIARATGTLVVAEPRGKEQP